MSSYTPTISELITIRQDVQALSIKGLKVLAAGVPAAPNQPQLPYAAAEIRVVQDAIFPPATHISLPPDEDCTTSGIAGVTVPTIVGNLPEATILHLACHGYQDFKNPLESSFVLQDGRLTVSKLMGLSTPKAFLAFLSACHSGKGDRGQPDQAIHLAAAMLFIGFRSVVGTLW